MITQYRKFFLDANFYTQGLYGAFFVYKALLYVEMVFELTFFFVGLFVNTQSVLLTQELLLTQGICWRHIVFFFAYM